MAEISTNVYDILFPSPAALKDIAAISIALRLWCQEINSHRIKNSLDKLDLQGKILSSDSMPRIPSMILSTIEKYVKRLGLSIKLWLQDHSYPDLFKSEIFNDFIDFVADFDGSIHYDWTAKRFVQCDKVDKLIRFHIACMYCFEDDILRIWPSVSSHERLQLTMNNTYIHHESLHYWICRAKNQLYKLSRSLTSGQSLEEQTFYQQIRYASLASYSTWSFVEYFWNRIDSDARMRFIAKPNLSIHKPYRYLLGKFNEVELDKFANSKGYQVIYDLLCHQSINYFRTSNKSYFISDVQDRTPFIMAIWTYIKEKMNGDNFFTLVQKIIREYGRLPISTPICCELWNTAPEHLKANAIQQLLSANSLTRRRADEYIVLKANIDGLFLQAVLSDASAEDKNTFWNTHWRNLINVMLAEEYDQLMRLCFSNDENIINEFKSNSLSGLANVRVKCVKLLKRLSLEELNKLLRFCYPDEQTRRSIQLNLLVEEFKVAVGNITLISPLFNDFINDAYDDVNLAADFKTQLLNSPSMKEKFTALVDSYSRHPSKFQREANFIDILAPSEQIARDLKKVFFIPLLQQKLIAGNFKSEIKENEFSNFIGECASNEDEIAEIKASLSADEMVQNVIRNVMNKAGGPSYNYLLVDFLEWYFISPQQLDEFKARYAEDDVFVKLITKSG